MDSNSILIIVIAVLSVIFVAVFYNSDYKKTQQLQVKDSLKRNIFTIVTVVFCSISILLSIIYMVISGFDKKFFMIALFLFLLCVLSLMGSKFPPK